MFTQTPIHPIIQHLIDERKFTDFLVLMICDKDDIPREVESWV